MKPSLGLSRVVLLLILTVVAVTVMFLVSAQSGKVNGKNKKEQEKQHASEAIPVSIGQFEPEMIELYDIYSGLLQPWERYSLAFEIAGRIENLGQDESSSPIDEGSFVRQRDLLAQLDVRIFRARKDEAEAKLQQANSHYRRAQQLKERGNTAITETEFQDRWTSKLLAEAEYEIAMKNLANATLRAPVDAVISRRFVNVGESVSPHVPAFELVETDRLLLVLGVPESRIPEILARRREVQHNQSLGDQALVSEENLEFRAYLELVGKNRYGEARPELSGTVHRISETADETTGLFEVEIELPNPEGRLRPGMVARARLVTSRVRGYRLPARSVLFRNNQAHLFTIVPQEDKEIFRAKLLKLPRWTELGPDIIIPESTAKISTVIIRGQHRLTDGQNVRIVKQNLKETTTLPPEITIRSTNSK